VAALDASVWSGRDRLPAAVTGFVLSLVGRRVARQLRIMADPWPAHLRPDQILWPTRLGRALRREGLLTPDRLEELTYGRLLDIPATGRKCALDLGLIADALAGLPAAPLGDGARRQLAEAATWTWTGRIGGHDLRFRDVLPPHPGRLADMVAEAVGDPDGRTARALAHALPAVVARADELGREPLDRAINRLCGAMGVSARDLAVTVGRFDRSRGRRRRLQDVGRQFSISKERARQVTDRTVERLDGAYLPQLRLAGQLLRRSAPITAADGARHLVDGGVATTPVDPSAVTALCELLGYPVPFEVDAGGGVPLVVPAGLAVGGAVMAVAGRLARRDGVVSVGQVVDALAPTAAAGTEVADARVAADGRLPAVVRLVLRTSPAVVVLVDDWLWLPDQGPGQHCLRNVTRRMLAVSSPIGLATARRGVVRQRHGVRVADVPPLAVLAAYYDAHPEFVVDGEAVRAARPVDAITVLTPAELAVVATLREAPAGRLSRAALADGAAARGVDRRQFDSLLTYTPVVDHVERDVWRLRS